MRINENAMFELNRLNFESALAKNDCIRKFDTDYVVFLNENVTGKAEVLDIFAENEFLLDYDLVAFGENLPVGEADFEAVISACDMNVFALGFSGKVLVNTGSFNEKLSAGTNYEFMCRAAEFGRVFCVSCAVEESARKSEVAAAGEALVVEDCVNSGLSQTMAYVLRKYMVKLRSAGILDLLFAKVSGYMTGLGMASEFNGYMEKYLGDSGEYDRVAAETAPFFVISGDDICHGVLKDFATCLAKELVNCGQAVITTDNAYGNYTGLGDIEGRVMKGIVGFQALVLENEFFRKNKSKKIQFFFDNPAFFDSLLKNLGEDYYVLCQDGLYAEFLKDYYNVKNSIHLPPAGKDVGLSGNEKREYDIVFIGTYNVNDESCIKNDFEMGYYEYMKRNPDETFENGLAKFLDINDIILDKENFIKLLYSLVDVCHCVINFYRAKVVETILEAGFKLDVYGDTWKLYDGKGKENLVIHPAVSVEESLEILGHSKVGLNVMTWHKAGMTERIANIMLSGAVCVSDETIYLRENFGDDEIVLFKLDELAKLPSKLERLLNDEEYRRKIADSAYEKAGREHTWKCRAKALIELVKED